MLNNYRFILIQVAAIFSCYVGQPNRFDKSKNQPIVVCCVASAKGNNNLGRRNFDYTNYNDGNGWRALFDNNGNNATVLPFGAGQWTESDSNQYYDGCFVATGDGKFMIFETPIIFWTDARCFGQLDGVMNIGKSGCPLNNGDIVYIDTIPWVFLNGPGTTAPGRCFVRLN